MHVLYTDQDGNINCVDAVKVGLSVVRNMQVVEITPKSSYINEVYSIDVGLCNSLRNRLDNMFLNECEFLNLSSYRFIRYQDLCSQTQ